MINEEISEIVADLIHISRKAGSIILKHYTNSMKAIQIKEDESPLTIADMESDEYIQKELHRLYDIPIISEENYPDYAIRKEYTEFFLVDPLDGTKEFIEGNGEFTVNIAYIKNNSPAIGVIYTPVTGNLFFAAEMVGSYLMDDKGTRQLPLKKPEDDNFTAIGSRKHSTVLDSAFMQMNNIHHVISAGSSLKFCKVAMGHADIYPRFQGSMEWDIAAGHIIAKAAGCKIVDLKTLQEPLYNKESLKNNYFVVLRNGLELSSLKIPDMI